MLLIAGYLLSGSVPLHKDKIEDATHGDFFL